MPRASDSDRTDSVSFIENVECPACGTVAECLFGTDATTVEELTDPPVAVHTCPVCGICSDITFSGWTFYTEAG